MGPDTGFGLRTEDWRTDASSLTRSSTRRDVVPTSVLGRLVARETLTIKISKNEKLV